MWLIFRASDKVVGRLTASKAHSVKQTCARWAKRNGDPVLRRQTSPRNKQSVQCGRRNKGNTRGTLLIFSSNCCCTSCNTPSGTNNKQFVNRNKLEWLWVSYVLRKGEMRNVWRILVKTNLENAHMGGRIGDNRITIK